MATQLASDLTAVLEQAEQAQQQGRTEQAYGFFAHATEMDPNSPAAWHGRAATASDPNDALVSLGYEAALKPEDAELRPQLDLYAQMVASVAGPSDAPTLVQAGQKLAGAGLTSQAELLFRRAVELDDKQADAWAWLAAVTPDPAESQRMLSRATELEPDHAIARAGLAAGAPTEIASAEEPPREASPAPSAETVLAAPLVSETPPAEPPAPEAAPAAIEPEPQPVTELPAAPTEQAGPDSAPAERAPSEEAAVSAPVSEPTAEIVPPTTDQEPASETSDAAAESVHVEEPSVPTPVAELPIEAPPAELEAMTSAHAAEPAEPGPISKEEEELLPDWLREPKEQAATTAAVGEPAQPEQAAESVPDQAQAAQLAADLVRQGEEALDAGDSARAYVLFSGATELAPHSEAAWLGRSQAVEETTEKIDCLQKVLEINPENLGARESLAFYQVRKLREEGARIPAPEEKAKPPEPAPEKPIATQPVPAPRRVAPAPSAAAQPAPLPIAAQGLNVTPYIVIALLLMALILIALGVMFVFRL